MPVFISVLEWKMLINPGAGSTVAGRGGAQLGFVERGGSGQS